MDVAGGGLWYDGFMKRVYLADAQTEERSALRLMLLDLNLQSDGYLVRLVRGSALPSRR